MQEEFNIERDLKPGDMIKRKNGNNGLVKDGDIVEFVRYRRSSPDAIKVLKNGEETSGGYAFNYDLISTKSKKESTVKINMKTDLEKGDKIRRINNNYTSSQGGTVVVGTIYTFKEYHSTYNDDLRVDEVSGTFSHDNFEFVGRNMIETTDFDYAQKGDRVYCMGKHEYGAVTANEPEEQYYKITVKFYDGVTQTYTYDGKLYSDDNNRSLYWEKPEFPVPTKLVQVPNKYYKELFIKALKKTAAEYLNGTHEFDVKKCHLCAAVREIHGDVNMGNRGKEYCAKCPWVVLTGKICHQVGDEMARVEEILEWIKKYEAMDEE